MAVSTVAITKVTIGVAGDKRGRIAIATILCAVVMIFMMPLIAYMGVVSNFKNIEFDGSQVTQEIIHVENTMKKYMKNLKTDIWLNYQKGTSDIS